MPRMVTEVVAGVCMYGDFIADGYVPADEKSDAGEKYYIQITAPNLNSYKARMTDSAYAQFMAADVAMGTPVLMDVRPMVFRDTQYWQAESFYVRPDGRQPFMRSSPAPVPAPSAVAGSASAPGSASGAAKKS